MTMAKKGTKAGKPAKKPQKKTPKKRTVGRPTKFTTEVRAAILEQIENRVPLKYACGGSGVDYSTFRYWLVDAEDNGKKSIYFEFAEEVKNAQAVGIQKHLKYIQDAADGDPENGMRPQWQAGAWILERTDHETFGRKDKVDMTAEHTGQVNYIIEIVGTDAATRNKGDVDSDPATDDDITE